MPKLNKPAIKGYKYAHPEETSAKSYTPHLEEDAVRSQRSDVERIRRGLDTAATKNAANRLRQQEAAGRAITRTGGRAGLAGAALQGGYEAGRALDEATGVGKKIVDKAGPLIDRASTGERVKLSKEAKQRVKDEEDFQDMQRALQEVEAERRESGKSYAQGGSVGSASRRADGCAQRGKTRGKIV